MKFSELVKERHSVRKYTSDKVEQEKLDIILEAGRSAPSAKNARPIKIIVVREQEGLAKAKKTADIYDAPLLLITCGNTEQAAIRMDGKSIVDVDTSIVVTQMMLQACDLGLGSVWIGWFDPSIIKEEFNIPDCFYPCSILAVGYAADDPIPHEIHERFYKPIGELVSYEHC